MGERNGVDYAVFDVRHTPDDLVAMFDMLVAPLGKANEHGLAAELGDGIAGIVHVRVDDHQRQPIADI